MKDVDIFCDGACSGNPGPGAAAAILRYAGKEKELVFDHPEDTSNQKMELQAAILGIAALKEPCQVTVYTDSNYVVQGMTKWIHNWKAKGWKASNKKPVQNKDLWMKLDEACSTHNINFIHIKGHDGHPENERVDTLAYEACQKLK